MGLSYLVFPGAHHTRFHHALGSMYLMQQAIQILRFKEVSISAEEEEGLLTAILLHDIGHGPFSHAMENSLVEGIQHEEISLHFMEALNKKFNGSLTLGIDIFKGSYHKKFLNQLVSSQLDMDRLDYLKRDSFYTGVAEGNINAERLITMLHAHNGDLIVEEKGIYSVEKFLMARRFMYWQVYLHKTGIVAEQLLINILRRAKELYRKGQELNGSKALLYFMDSDNARAHFTPETLDLFSQLDDVDIMAAIKKWQGHEDFVLSKLCTMVLQRQLLKIKIRKEPIQEQLVQEQLRKVSDTFKIDEKEAAYFVFTGEIQNQAYDQKGQNINILRKNGQIIDVAEASDHLNLAALAKTVSKHYICFPKSSVT